MNITHKLARFVFGHPVRILFCVGLIWVGWTFYKIYKFDELRGEKRLAGLCFEENRFVSDEEKIRKAIAYENIPHSLSNRYDEIDANGKFVSISRNASAIIPYDSVDEFIKQNPDCCSVQPLDPNNDKISYGERWEGHYGYVSVKYIVHYVDSNGVKLSKKLGTAIYISNCGNHIS